MSSADRMPHLRPYVVSADTQLLERAEALGYLVQHSFSASGAAWFEALRALDRMLFNASGMVLPGWVFYDCALAPGCVVGLAESAADKPTPVSLAIAIPTANPELQLVHTLGAVSSEAGLLGATWELLVASLGWAAASGGGIATAGWGSEAEVFYTSSAPVALLAAWMPAYDAPMTATFGLGPYFQAVPAAATIRTVSCEEGPLRALQAELDAGGLAWVRHVSRSEGESPRLEIAYVGPAAEVL